MIHYGDYDSVHIWLFSGVTYSEIAIFHFVVTLLLNGYMF